MIRTPSFWYQSAGLLSTILSPFSWVYRVLSQGKINRTPRYDSKIPVICIGNLTAGGSGKTPVVGAIAKILTTQGKKPHILSRGYGAKIKSTTQVNTETHTAREVGDEPFMHAQKYPCWISSDRVQGAKMIERGRHANLILMDDGFQNPHLHKDISIVVVDGGVAFGNEKIMPAGPLRELIDEGIKRAHALVILGDDRHYLKERFEYLLPVFQAHLVPDVSAKIWKGKKVIGFTGIGRPEKFRQTLLSIGVKLKEFVPFADHHFFNLHDITRLLNLAKKHDAQLVTTDKDWGRLPLGYQNMVAPIPVKIKWKDKKALIAFLKKKGV